MKTKRVVKSIMKKSIITLISFAVILTGIINGCGSKNSSSVTEESGKKNPEQTAEAVTQTKYTSDISAETISNNDAEEIPIENITVENVIAMNRTKDLVEKYGSVSYGHYPEGEEGFEKVEFCKSGDCIEVFWESTFFNDEEVETVFLSEDKPMYLKFSLYSGGLFQMDSMESFQNMGYVLMDKYGVLERFNSDYGVKYAAGRYTYISSVSESGENYILHVEVVDENYQPLQYVQHTFDIVLNKKTGLINKIVDKQTASEDDYRMAVYTNFKYGELNKISEVPEDVINACKQSSNLWHQDYDPLDWETLYK